MFFMAIGIRIGSNYIKTELSWTVLKKPNVKSQEEVQVQN